MAAWPACPSGVEYGALIEDSRAQLERHVPRSLADRLFRRLLFSLFPYRERLRWLRPVLFAWQRSGPLHTLPARMQALEALAPTLMPEPRSECPATRQVRRGRVGLLTGCVQGAFFAHVNAATRRVLAAEGYEVVTARAASAAGREPRALLGAIPSLTVVELAEPMLCCGSAGVYNLLQPETAAELGDRKIGRLLRASADALESANPGCLLQLGASLRRAGRAELPALHTIELLVHSFAA